ncbi:hypothetical protein AAGT00_12755 [Streptomyces cavourensis]
MMKIVNSSTLALDKLVDVVSGSGARRGRVGGYRGFVNAKTY